MNIGGYDIRIETSLQPIEIRSIIINIFMKHWSKALIELDTITYQFTKYSELILEAFVYPNKEEFLKEYSNKMIYCIFDHPIVTLVIDNKDDKEINSIIEEIKKEIKS